MSSPPHPHGAGSGGGPGSEPPVDRLRARSRTFREEGRAFADAARALGGELSEVAREQLEARPYWTLGAVFATGWVLGGGIPPRLFSLGGEVAARAAAHALAAKLAGSLMGSMGMEGPGASAGTPDG